MHTYLYLNSQFTFAPSLRIRNKLKEKVQKHEQHYQKQETEQLHILVTLKFILIGVLFFLFLFFPLFLFQVIFVLLFLYLLLHFPLFLIFLHLLLFLHFFKELFLF